MQGGQVNDNERWYERLTTDWRREMFVSWALGWLGGICSVMLIVYILREMI